MSDQDSLESKNLLINWVSLSDISHLSVPNIHNMLFQMKFRTLDVEMMVTDSTSIHFMKYSMATIRNFNYRVAQKKGPSMFVPKRPKGIYGVQDLGWCLMLVHVFLALGAPLGKFLAVLSQR